MKSFQQNIAVFSPSPTKIRQNICFRGVQVSRQKKSYMPNNQHINILQTQNNSGFPLFYFTVSCYCAD